MSVLLDSCVDGWRVLGGWRARWVQGVGWVEGTTHVLIELLDVCLFSRIVEWVGLRLWVLMEDEMGGGCWVGGGNYSRFD